VVNGIRRNILKRERDNLKERLEEVREELNRLPRCLQSLPPRQQPRHFVMRVTFVHCAIFLLAVGFFYHQVRLDDLDKWRENVEIRLRELEEAVRATQDWVIKLDKKIDGVALEMKQYYDKKLEEQNYAIKKLDDNLIWLGVSIVDLGKRIGLVEEKLNSASYFRNLLGLGCFPEGTMIQIDKAGNVAPIETLLGGASIWNPDLGKEVLLRFRVIGYENGTLYTFTLNDGLTVRVTETHPMKVLSNSTFSSNIWVNVAAKDVAEGSWMVTVNGKQQVTKITTLEVVDLLVYNLEYALDEDVHADNQRSLIADGVHTYDFAAQKKHHK
jgi:hypothetical protein